MKDQQIAVIGGGLAGLTAAAFIARTGKRITLYERSATLGGRAATANEDGFLLNQGPHALYKGAPGHAILQELGLGYTGGYPKTGTYAFARGSLHTFPAGAGSIVTTSLFGLPDKLEAARFFMGLGRLDPAGLESVPLNQWLQQRFHNASVRDYVGALARISTYTNAPDQLSAAAAIDGLRSAVSGVLYVDGGWQTLVDGLAAQVWDRGGRIKTSAPVERVTYEGEGYSVLLREDGAEPAASVVLAAPPEVVKRVVDLDRMPALGGSLDAQIPVRMAVLDLGLDRLPVPERNVALGIDAPLYLSTHSAGARLAPEGKALITLGKYLDPAGESDPDRDLAEMEALMELTQPGWRQHVAVRRFLPGLTVVNGLLDARRGGYAGRPPVEVAEAPGLYLAGDWVGSEGQLANASIASGKQAAMLALRRLENAVPTGLPVAV